MTTRGRALFEKSALPRTPTRKNFDRWGGGAAEVPLGGGQRDGGHSIEFPVRLSVFMKETPADERLR